MNIGENIDVNIGENIDVNIDENTDENIDDVKVLSSMEKQFGIKSEEAAWIFSGNKLVIIIVIIIRITIISINMIIIMIMITMIVPNVRKRDQPDFLHFLLSNVGENQTSLALDLRCNAPLRSRCWWW